MITFIPTPIGNPQDITLRAMKLFEKAELFLCEDTRQTKRLLRLLEERFDMTYPEADFYSFNEHNGQQRLDEFGSSLEGKEVIYVSDAGMPVISAKIAARPTSRQSRTACVYLGTVRSAKFRLRINTRSQEPHWDCRLTHWPGWGQPRHGRSQTAMHRISPASRRPLQYR